MQRVALAIAFTIAMGAAFVFAFAQQTIPVGPPHDSGERVTAAFEGWFPNPDGSVSMLFGYFNQNFKQEPDIPIGPDNRIEPGGPDQGQPTHFLTRRRWGLFTGTVPENFGTNKLTRTIVGNRKQTQWPARPVFTGKGTQTASLDEPGEYPLHVGANDWSGEGGRGFQCCWSNAQVNVSVK